mgnify:CR=1 FL=1
MKKGAFRRGGAFFFVKHPSFLQREQQHGTYDQRTARPADERKILVPEPPAQKRAHHRFQVAQNGGLHRGKVPPAVFGEPGRGAVGDATSEEGAAAGAGPLRVPDTKASDRPARARPEDAPDSLRPADSLHGDAAAE